MIIIDSKDGYILEIEYKLPKHAIKKLGAKKILKFMNTAEPKPVMQSLVKNPITPDTVYYLIPHDHEKVFAEYVVAFKKMTYRCEICQSSRDYTISGTVSLTCKHTFCAPCLKAYIKSIDPKAKYTCPTCGVAIASRFLPAALVRARLRTIRTDDSDQKCKVIKLPDDFIFRCPNEANDLCSDKGYISGDYNTTTVPWYCKDCRCGMCPRCEAVVSLSDGPVTTKTIMYIRDTQTVHICNPDEVATIDDKRKNYVKCPYCKTFVFKASGCNHIHCASCDQHFDYVTGRLLGNMSRNNEVIIGGNTNIISNNYDSDDEFTIAEDTLELFKKVGIVTRLAATEKFTGLNIDLESGDEVEAEDKLIFPQEVYYDEKPPAAARHRQREDSDSDDE